MAPPPKCADRVPKSSGGVGGEDEDDFIIPEDPPVIKKKVYSHLTTYSPDPRFPNANVTNFCFVMYSDFFRCQCLLGAQYFQHEPCEYFKKVFTAMCPREWIERWDDMRDRGVFPGSLGPQL